MCRNFLSGFISVQPGTLKHAAELIKFGNHTRSCRSIGFIFGKSLF